MTGENQESLFGKADRVLLLWLILFGFGGGLFALYYSNIGYIPDIKWEDSVVYLGALTIAGAFLFVLYFFLLFIPGWMWSELLLFDKESRSLLCAEDRHGVFEPQRMKLLIAVGIPFGIFQFVIHFLLDKLYPLGGPFDGLTFLSGVVVTLMFSSWLMRALVLRSATKSAAHEGDGQEVASSKTPETVKPPNWIRVIISRFWSSKNLPFENVIFFSVPFLTSVFSLLIFRYSFDTKASGLMNIVCTLAVTLVNLFVAVSCKKDLQKSIAVMAGAALLLMVLGDILVNQNDAKLSARIMSKFGIGYGHPVTLLLNTNGIAILERYKSFGVQVETSPGEGSAKGLEILSRLGSEYFLRVPATGRSFSFPKSGIVSWVFEDSETGHDSAQPPPVALGAADPAPVVTEVVPVKGPPAN